MDAISIERCLSGLGPQYGQVNYHYRGFRESFDGRWKAHPVVKDAGGIYLMKMIGIQQSIGGRSVDVVG